MILVKIKGIERWQRYFVEYTGKFEIRETISQMEKFVNRERTIYLISIKRNQTSFFFFIFLPVVLYANIARKKNKVRYWDILKTEWKIIKVNSKKSGKKYLMDRNRTTRNRS